MSDDNDLKARDLMSEIKVQLAELESAKPTRIDGLSISSTSKLPLKVMWFKAALGWRMSELSKTAFDALEREQFASAIILTRAAAESCAALWSLSTKIQAAVKSGAVGDIGTHLMRFIMGHRGDAEMPDAVNVLTCVDRVDKDVDGFRHHYDVLSEYAHPNWAGTVHIYSQPHPGEGTVSFGNYIRGAIRYSPLP